MSLRVEDLPFPSELRPRGAGVIHSVPVDTVASGIDTGIRWLRLCLGLFMGWSAVGIVAAPYVDTLSTLGIAVVAIMVSLAPFDLLDAWTMRRTR